MDVFFNKVTLITGGTTLYFSVTISPLFDNLRCRIAFYQQKKHKKHQKRGEKKGSNHGGAVNGTGTVVMMAFRSQKSVVMLVGIVMSTLW